MNLSLPRQFPLFILASSVSWSLQCLISALTQGGGGRHFLGSLVQWCCGEGGTLQTNITGMCGECSQCLSHTGPAPAHSACALPAHTAQAVGCSTRNPPRPALGCMHLPGLNCSGSGTWVLLPQRRRLGWACILCPSQVQAAQVTKCLESTVAATYQLPCPCRSVF